MGSQVISSANTSLHDLMTDVGMESIGDDLAGIEVISLVTSSTVARGPASTSVSQIKTNPSRLDLFDSSIDSAV